MPVDQENYNHRGGGNYGIVVLLPNTVAPDRLVYFDYNRDRHTWVIRDFIGGQRLDNGHSPLGLVQIEADATHDEFPVWCNVEMNPVDWQMYLLLRTTAVLRIGGPLRNPRAVNTASGTWLPI